MREFFLFLVAVVLGILLLPISFLIGLLLYIKKLPKYLFSVAIGIDQLGGSIVYCQPDWTVSSYSYYLYLKNPKYKVIVKLIDLFFGKNHCKNSFNWELNLSERLLQEMKNDTTDKK